MPLSPDPSDPQHTPSSGPNIPDASQDKNLSKKITIEELLEAELRSDIDQALTDALVNAAPAVIDLSMLIKPRLINAGVNYHELDQRIIDNIERVVWNRLAIVNPLYIQAVKSGQARLDTIYVNGNRITKLSSDMVGKIVSIVGVTRDIAERVVAAEILYRCQGCGSEKTAKADDPTPKCTSRTCTAMGQKMAQVDIARESHEVSFMLKISDGQIICRGEKRRVCDINHDKWYIMPGIECEVTGIIKRAAKKTKEVEYWIEVLGARILHIDEKMSEPLQTLDDVRRCFPQIVGEDGSILLSILAMASRNNLDRMFWILGIVIQGQSSSGKSYLMKHVTAPWKVMGRVIELSRFTGAFIERMAQILQKNNVDNLIIAVPELFSNTPQQLHVLLSEGKLSLGVVDKESGEPIIYEIEGQPFLIATTTAVEFREDLLNRVLTIKIDETEDQTKRILQNWVAASNRERQDVNMESGIVRLVNHLKTLKPALVIVPYAETLLKLFDGLELPVTMRRDFPKMLSIIMSSALFFQNNRPRTSIMMDGEAVPAVIATLDDYENMIRLYGQLNVTITRLSPLDTKILEILRVASEEDGQRLTRKEVQKRLAEERLYYHDSWIFRTLRKLVNMGYVEEDTSSKPFRYTASKTPKEIDLNSIKPEIEQKVAEYLSRTGIST